MNFSDLKRRISLPVVLLISFIFIFSSAAQATSSDIQAELTDSAGATGLSIQNSSGNQVARIDSYGDLTAQGNVGIGTSATGAGGVNVLLYVSPQGLTPEYAVGAGDAYIQNNLEVDGTTYLNDVYINGLEVNGATFQGGQSADTLTVTGSAFLAITSGNVGIGTSSPGSKLAVNGGAAIGTALSYLSTAAPSNGLMVQGNVGIGSLAPGQALDVQGTVRSLGFTTNGAYTQSGGSSNTFTGVSTFSNATNSALFTGGNVGINSTVPGEQLDVEGTIRTTNFIMNGVTSATGYVLTAVDSNGTATWSPAGTIEGWTELGSDVYTSTGITNVGIGSTVPGEQLDVQGTVRDIGEIVNGSIATIGGYTQTGSSANTLSGNTSFTGIPTFSNAANSALFTGGNVGINSTVPGEQLDVEGTIRTTNFIMNGVTSATGYVLTAVDSNGTATWSPAGTIEGWTELGSDVYTSTGITNVGIGSTVPGEQLDVQGTVRDIGEIVNGSIATIGGYTQTGSSANTLSGNTSFTGIPTFSNAANSALFTGGNVGINSTVPGEQLDVEGTIRTTNFIMNGVTSATGYVLTAVDSNGTATWSPAGTIEGWTELGSDVYTSTGITNVGIGSTVPGEQLDVQGTVRDIGEIVNGSIATIGGYTQTGSSANTLSGNTSFTGIPTFSNAANSALFTGGNVGINSTVPGEQLDVEGTIRTTNFIMNGVTSATGYVLTAVDSNGTATWSPAGTIEGWTELGSDVYTSTGITNVGIGSTVPGEQLDVQGTVRDIGEIVNGSIATIGGYTQSGGSSNTFTGVSTFSNATNSALFTGGNVGINSTVPGEQLDVQGTVRDIGEIVNGSIATIGGYTQTGSSANTLSGNTSFTGIPTFSNATNSALFTGGNVGINSTVPGEQLDVEGTIRTTNFIMNGVTSATGYVLTAVDSNGTATWSPAGTIEGWTELGSDVYTSTGITNVGIGSTVPGEQLDVQGTVRDIGEIVNGSIATIGGYTQTGSSANTLSGNTSFTGIPTFSNAANSALFTGGNVGINSTLPGQALDVQGTVRDIGEIVNGSIATIGGYTQTGSSANTLSGNTSFTGIPTFSNAANSALFTGGNVGINSTVPGEQLDVEGTIRTTNFIMNGVTSATGYVLTAVDSNGTATWSPAGTIEGWTELGSDVYTSTGITNVGIGSTVPGEQLDVQGTVRDIGEIVNGSIATIGGYTQTGSSANTLSGNTSFTGIPTFSNATNSALFTGGNVGINSTVPGEQLDVQGTVRSLGFTTNGAYTQSGGSSNTFTGVSTFSNATNSALFTGGNVGINSTVPGEQLDVEGTIRTTNFIMNGVTSATGYVLTAVDSTGTATWSPAGTIEGWTELGSDVYTSTGITNVGIGSTVPGEQLDVQGTVRDIGEIVNGSIATIGGYTQSGGSSNTFTGVSTFSNATNSALFTGGNVGINSTVPGEQLDVQGTVRDIGEIVNGSIATIGGYTQTGSSANTLSGNTSFTGIPTFSNATNSALFTGGNVGINSTVPGEQLDVEGTIRTTNFIMNGVTSATGYVLTAVDSTGTATWTAAGSSSGWTITNTNDVYETFSGNVGIGTSITNAGAALSVMNGNVGIGTWAPAGELIVQGGNVGIGTNRPPVLFAVGSGSPQRETGAGNAYFGNDVEIAGTLYADLGVVGGETFSGDLDLNGFFMKSTNSGGNGNGTVLISGGNGPDTVDLVVAPNHYVGIGTSTPKNQLSVEGGVGIGTAFSNYLTTVAPAGGIIVQGNVGIGSLAPGEQLDVQGTVRDIGEIVNGSIATIGGYTQTGSSANTLSGNTSFTGIPTFSNATNSALFTGGNVGINSTVPGEQLDVEGTIRTTNFIMNGVTSATGYVLTAVDSTGTATWTAAGSVGPWTLSGTDLYTTGNNVGINSTLPGQALDVQGTVRSTGFITTGGYTQTGSSANTLSGNTSFTGIPTFSNAANSALFTGGNVGINSTVPGEQLDVQGTVRDIGEIVNGSIATIGGYTQTGSSANTLSGNTSFTGIPTFSNATNSALFTGGNVGINSTVPGEQLDVEGTIRTTNFIMNGVTSATGYVLTAVDSTGTATWTAAGSVGPWTLSGTDLYTTGNNVGINSTLPGEQLDVQGTVRAIGEVVNGNVGIGTSALQIALAVTNGNVGIGTWTSSSTFSVIGSMAVRTVIVTSASSPYSASANDQIIIVDATSGNVTVNLPAVTSVPGREYIIKRKDSSGNTVTIAANASPQDTIDGQDTVSITLQYQSFTIVSDGSNWDII